VASLGERIQINVHRGKRRRLYVLDKLELHESNFLSQVSGLLADEVWVAWRTVMVHDFAVDKYREMWSVAKKFLVSSFVMFVDNEILPIAERVRECPESIQQAPGAPDQ
jgi:hypothetical protein